MCQTWILIIISILCAIGQYNLVLHIGIHDIDALDLQEKSFFSIIFLEIKVCPSNELNLESRINLRFFYD